MWLYVQSTGDLFSGSSYVETGYSGAVPGGKNDPSKECVRNVGPIPRGYYSVGSAIQTPTPTTLPLTADNPAYCTPPRSGFLIHGDNSTSTASQGCIILSRATRDRINASDDQRLRVVANSALVRAIKKRVLAESRGLL